MQDMKTINDDDEDNTKTKTLSLSTEDINSDNDTVLLVPFNIDYEKLASISSS